MRDCAPLVAGSRPRPAFRPGWGPARLVPLSRNLAQAARSVQAMARRGPPPPAGDPGRAPVPGARPPGLAAAWRRRGTPRLYSHQAEAYAAARSGRHLVVVTPTASGKTLCYNLPVLQRLLENPSSRSLYLFP